MAMYPQIYPGNLGDFVQTEDSITEGNVPITDDNNGGAASIIPDQNTAHSELVRLIQASALYKQAYRIFSSDSRYGTPFLQQLIAIPESVSITEKNFWDDFSEFFGATSKYEEALKDAYNTAMDEIRSLIAEYYSFKNSLPSEQVEQLREAGINAGVTGQDVTGSELDSEGLVHPNTPMSQYSNSQVSDGITSFVNFIGSMVNLGSAGVNAVNLLGLLDIAEQEQYSKQELHDAMLAELGITQDSPFRVLKPSPVLADRAGKAVSDAKVARAKSDASAGLLESDISVPIGNDSDSVQEYEIMSGQDVLNAVSRMQLVEQFGRGYVNLLTTQNQQLFADLVSSLDQQQIVANLSAGIAEGNFNSAFFNARSGALEGLSQTNIAEALASIRQSEAFIQEFNSWIADYKYQQLDSWGKQIASKPFLAPYFYKAMFDFNMNDTFYHQSPLTQGLKYGVEIGNGVLGFISNFIPTKIPKRLTRSVTNGPRGSSETITETIVE